MSNFIAFLNQGTTFRACFTSLYHKFHDILENDYTRHKEVVSKGTSTRHVHVLDQY